MRERWFQKIRCVLDDHDWEYQQQGRAFVRLCLACNHMEKAVVGKEGYRMRLKWTYCSQYDSDLQGA